MKRIMLVLLVCAVSSLAVAGKSPTAPAGELAVREIHYAAQLGADEARLTLDLEADATGVSMVKLLEGDVALLPMRLPDGLKILRHKSTYLLVASRAGHFEFSLEVVAKIQRAEPWNQISFTGPAATIASVTAQAGGTSTEVQLLTGTLLEKFKLNDVSGVKGFLGADQTVALRWQGKVTEIARKALLTVASTLTAQVAPAVIKYTSKFHYDIVQGSAAQLTLMLPAAQALTKLEGEQIRDWHTTTEGDEQKLIIEFIKPLEKAYDLVIHSEQAAEITSPLTPSRSPSGGEGARRAGEGAYPGTALNPPQPLDTDRESGSLTIYAEDTLVEVVALEGLRQVNAPDNAVIAYRFNARPFSLALKLTVC